MGLYKSMVDDSLHHRQTKSVLEQALIEGDCDPLYRLMDNFWRSLTEIKIMPLTTDYFPDMRDPVINEKYI